MVRDFLKRMLGAHAPGADVGHALYLAVVERARAPVFYTDFAVPDTVDGRFELISLHAFLVMRRLKEQGTEAEEVAQALFDILFRDMDRSLREMGVGDMSVGKKVKQMMTAFYGRAKAYDSALAQDRDELALALRRNLYGTLDAAPAPDVLAAMAIYLHGGAGLLAAAPLAEIVAGRVDFGAPPARR